MFKMLGKNEHGTGSSIWVILPGQGFALALAELLHVMPNQLSTAGALKSLEVDGVAVPNWSNWCNNVDKTYQWQKTVFPVWIP